MAEAQDVVLLAAFQVDRKRVRAILHGGHVAWEPCKAGRQNRRHQVPLTDVVNVTVNSATLTLHYGTRGRSDHQWRLQRTSFVATDVAVVDLWRTEIQRQIKLQDYRPKYLLIFVNPFDRTLAYSRTWPSPLRTLHKSKPVRRPRIMWMAQVVTSSVPWRQKATVFVLPPGMTARGSCGRGRSPFDIGMSLWRHSLATSPLKSSAKVPSPPTHAAPSYGSKSWFSIVSRMC
uniref:DAGKc domain-containing protein n=1 Tax=Phlebotomus papatasi TaxID=29031 RepID=A0A1B0DGW5_PHLPP